MEIENSSLSDLFRVVGQEMRNNLWNIDDNGYKHIEKGVLLYMQADNGEILIEASPDDSPSP